MHVPNASNFSRISTEDSAQVRRRTQIYSHYWFRSRIVRPRHCWVRGLHCLTAINVLMRHLSLCPTRQTKLPNDEEVKPFTLNLQQIIIDYRMQLRCKVYVVKRKDLRQPKVLLKSATYSSCVFLTSGSGSSRLSKLMRSGGISCSWTLGEWGKCRRFSWMNCFNVSRY